MKPIPLTLILVGGIMVYAGHLGTTPLAVLRAVLTGQTIPSNTYGTSSTPGAAANITNSQATGTTPTGTAPATTRGGTSAGSNAPYNQPTTPSSQSSVSGGGGNF